MKTNSEYWPARLEHRVVEGKGKTKEKLYLLVSARGGKKYEYELTGIKLKEVLNDANELPEL